MKTLEDLNREHTEQLLAPIIYLVILLIIGVPGNFTVLIIYGKRYTRCVYRSIIWNLAIADLILCTAGIPFNIVRVVRYYTFQGNWTCKIFSSLLFFGIMYSTHLLMLLSVHRFRQVCMPLKKQITTDTVKYWVIGSFCLSLLFSWPQVVLEEMEHPKLDYNLTGHICPITSSDPSIYWIVNNIILLCQFIIYTIVLFVIYSLIGRKVYLLRRKSIRSRGDNLEASPNNFSSKMTKIAFTISVVFALSYIPLFVLRVTKGGIDEHKLNSFEFALLRLTERSYLINHMANPFIYAIFDNRFRREFKSIITFKYKYSTSEKSIGESSTNTTKISKTTSL